MVGDFQRERGKMSKEELVEISFNPRQAISYTIGPYRFTKERPTHSVPRGMALRLRREEAFRFENKRPEAKETGGKLKKAIFTYWPGQALWVLLRLAEFVKTAKAAGCEPIFVNIAGTAESPEAQEIKAQGYKYYEINKGKRYSLDSPGTFTKTHRGYDIEDILAFYFWRLHIENENHKAMHCQMMIDFIDAFEAILKKEKPDYIFIWGDMAAQRRAAVKIGDRLGIPIIRVEGGFFPDSLTVDRTGMYFNKENDFIKIWKYTKDEPLSHSQKERLQNFLEDWKLAGASKYTQSRFQGPQHPVSAEVLRAKFGIKPEDKIVFVPCQTTGDATMYYPETLIRTKEELAKLACESMQGEKGWKVLIKPHPYEKEGELPEIVSKYENAQIVRGISVISLCDLADVVLTINSTVGFEALCLGKPVVTLGDNIYTGKGLTSDVLDDTRPSPLKHLGETLKKAQPPDTQLLERFLYRVIFNYLFFYDMDNGRIRRVLQGRPHINLTAAGLPQNNWVFGPMAKHIQDFARDTDISITDEPDEDADLRHYWRESEIRPEAGPYAIGIHGCFLSIHSRPENQEKYQGARLVLPVCEQAKSFLRDIAPERIKVIHAGADPSLFQLHENTKGGKFKIAVLGWNRPLQGAIADIKGSLTIGALAQKLSPEDFGFIFAGIGWEGITLFIKNQGFEVEFWGRKVSEFPIKYAEYFEKVYKKADCLLVASKAEGGPIPLYEAMMCGLPVIARPVGVVPEFVEDGKTGFVFDTPEEGAEALMRARGVNWDANYIRGRVLPYTWERWAREHEKVYWQVWLDQGVA